MFDPNRPTTPPALNAASAGTPSQLAGTTPTDATPTDRAPTPPPADEGPLAGLPDAAAPDPALQPQAAVFFTPHGRTLVNQIATLQAYEELSSAAALHDKTEAAADALSSQPGRAVLLSSGAHHAPSSLMQFHAAVDACTKHGWPLLLELEAQLFEQLQGLVRFLEAEPQLRQLLGKVPLSSRAGQQIAWNYIRKSGDRGALQKFLPEVLACIDIRRSGIRLVHVDAVGPQGGSDTKREASMARNTNATLPEDGKAVLVLGLAHAMPMHVRLGALGVTCSEIAVLDESVNHAPRLFDDADGDNPTFHTAVVHSHNLALPHYRVAASHTEAYRMPADLNPFR